MLAEKAGSALDDQGWSIPALSTHKDAHFTLSGFHHSLSHAGPSLSGRAIPFLCFPTV